MHLIEATAAPVFDLPGVAFTALASPSRGSAELCTWKLTVEAGLPPPQPHSLDRDEIFMVTAGAVLIGVDGTLVGAGDAVVVPAGTSIQLANPGRVDAEIFVAIRAGFTATAADGTVIGTPPWAI
jgi:mannose-6-phosphate isomerase-like protein (cupin superfamily)